MNGGSLKYPRVLLISRSEIHDGDTSGISRGRWFADWPKDRIAHVYSAAAPTSPPFCPIRYEFGGNDRRFGRLFQRLKGSSFGDAFRVQTVKRLSDSPLRKFVRRAKCALVSQIINSGAWELLFMPRPSSALLEWIYRFEPDVIYTTCTDLSYLRLSLRLREILEIPICLQVEDDWMASLYTRRLLSPVLRPMLSRGISELLSKSAIRFSTGPAMSAAFLQRYGVDFEPLFLTDKVERFDNAPPVRRPSSARFHIIYSGSLYLGRWKGLIDLRDAIAKSPLREETEIQVFTGHIPPEASSAISACPGIRVFPGLSDAEVPGIFKGADLLFLPESFEKTYVDYIRYSISSKAHLYMMSGQPSLVYGPTGIGVVEYAKSEGWAAVVDQESPSRLLSMVEALLRDPASASATLTQARNVALRNHDATAVRESFRQAMVRCAGALPDPLERTRTVTQGA